MPFCRAVFHSALQHPPNCTSQSKLSSAKASASAWLLKLSAAHPGMGSSTRQAWHTYVMPSLNTSDPFPSPHSVLPLQHSLPLCESGILARTAAVGKARLGTLRRKVFCLKTTRVKARSEVFAGALAAGDRKPVISVPTSLILHGACGLEA